MRNLYCLLAVLLGLVVVGTTPAAAQMRDPFAALQRDLSRAADFHLELVQEAARRAATVGPRQEKNAQASEADWSRKILASVSADRVAAARQRLQAQGVDAGRIFAEEGVPLELLLIAAVESDYNPLAVSSKGARGLWQLMPETAARLGLRVDNRTDERLHPVRSTRAAARYLRELYLQFGDWLLALASYNAGEARVASAIQRAGGRGDFWLLSEQKLLPAETLGYVPAVLRGGTIR